MKLTVALAIVLASCNRENWFVNAAKVDGNQNGEKVLKCAKGWTSSSSSSSNQSSDLQEIPADWINDGYCDCPIDGMDEPDTEACSGSQSWPGIVVKKDDSDSSSSSSPTTTALKTPIFVCSQQPNLLLPLSRLHDGICDCCDGQDEQPNDGSVVNNKCIDQCAEILKAEREARARLEHDYKVGSQKRQQASDEFAALRQSKLKEVQEMETKLENTVKASLESIQGQIKDKKQEYVKSRVATMKDSVVGSSLGQELIPPISSSILDRSEVIQLIIHTCQMAGEIFYLDNGNINAQNSNACIPLRMAGLDMALTWDDDNYENIDSMKGDVDMKWEMIQLLYENAIQNNRMEWKINNKSGAGNRRRLDDTYPDDDDYMGEYDDIHDYGDDDVTYDDEPVRNIRVDEGEPEAYGKEKEFIDEVAMSDFSKTRHSFLERSKQIVSEISKILDNSSDDDAEEASTDDTKDENIAETEEKDNKVVEAALNVDPAAYTMVRNDLRNKEGAIQKGLQWGASAKLLFTFSNQSDENIRRLAIGTIYYGHLNAIHIWQILQSILPEYKSNIADEETCGSPWANSCPPKTITRMGVTYPPSVIMGAATSFCEQEASKNSNADAQEVCVTHQQQENASTVTIPTSIPDGYYGYSSPSPRDKDDPLSVNLFAPMDNLFLDMDGMKALEDKKKQTENEKKHLERSINDLWKEIGGKEGDQMGENGELHAMADKCFDVLAGKYTYEVCVFGRASQKEGKVSGTSLGNWKGIEKDEDTGKRVMMWTDGQKCWNGPKRSATVYVTCGAETKLISADEPDTCRYVFEMESPIGCDEDYKILAGL